MSVETPCIRICVLDEGGHICTGCGRTIEEIAGWRSLTPEERRQIMAELEERLQRFAEPTAAR